jgi:uncharacterized protein
MSAESKTGVVRPGEFVHFADRDDLLEKLDRMAVDLPNRNLRRSRDDREHFQMRGYLRFLAGEDLLPLPVTLRKSPLNQDPPDFVLEWPDNRRETFELVEGTTRKYQQELTAAERAGETELILPIDIDTPTRDAAGLWAQILFATYREKAKDLVSGRYTIDHLLIFDNTGLGLFSPLDEGAPLLRAEIERWLSRDRPSHRYARVSILRGLDLLLDVTGEARLLSAESPYFRVNVIRAHGDEDLRRRLRAIDRYCREHSIRHLKLFGSVLKDVNEDEWEAEGADDGFGPESDLDLLVEFEPGTEVTLFDMARMERELGELIGMPVDLRTAGDLSRYFRQKVLSEAVELRAQ